MKLAKAQDMRASVQDDLVQSSSSNISALEDIQIVHLKKPILVVHIMEVLIHPLCPPCRSWSLLDESYTTKARNWAAKKIDSHRN